MQHLNCDQQGCCLSENVEAAKALVHRNTHTYTHAQPVLLCLFSQHVQSNYRERTRPRPCTPSDLAPGQIDEALYHPGRSNNSFLALITRTREDLQVFDLCSMVTHCTGISAAFIFHLSLNKKEQRSSLLSNILSVAIV